MENADNQDNLIITEKKKDLTITINRTDKANAISRAPVNPLTDLPKYYKTADLCVQTSIAEGLGLSPIEALACGIPVIVTEVGGLTDLIEDGIYGRVIAPQDVDALKDAIIFSIRNRELMKTWAKSAKYKISSRYTDDFAFKRIREYVVKLSH